MKKVRFLSIVFSIFILILLLMTSVSACTGFTAKKDGIVLSGHNKDWWSPDSYINVYPPEEGKYGRIFFEIPYPIVFNNNYHVLAGGINDQGLFFESYVTPFSLASFELFKPPLFKSPVSYMSEHFSTVEEVVDFMESHNLFFLNYLLCSGQVFVIDKTGDAAIIEGDDIIRIEGGYQVCTNFLQSNPGLGNHPCWRYDTAVSMLEEMTDLSVDYFNDILHATHQVGFTQYSTICDLNNGVVTVYHFHDYENGVELNLQDEFLLGEHSYYLPSLFEPLDNQPPEIPEMPIGPSSADSGDQCIFETNTTDLDNPSNEIYYKWDFGDGTQTYWILNRPPYYGKAGHIWESSGTFSVKVKARDIYGKESDWSEPLDIVVSKSKNLGIFENIRLFNSLVKILITD